MNYFNATRLAKKCNKSVYDYMAEYPHTFYGVREDGLWMFYRDAPAFIEWCLDTAEEETFSAREYFGEREWKKVKNPSRFGIKFKQAVIEGAYPDIEYAGYNDSKRRDMYRCV